MRKKEDTCAIIFADGFENLPSPANEWRCVSLLKILGITLLQHILTSVKNVGISDVYVYSSIEQEKVKNECKKIIPTAIVNGDLLFDDFEKTLAISGDVFFDIDLSELLRFHSQNKNDVTMVVPRKEDPTLFQSVYTDKDGNVEKILDKPSWSKVSSGKVNGKIYVLSENALQNLARLNMHGFYKNFTQALLKNGNTISAFYPSGKWFYARVLDEYKSAQKYAHSKKADGNKNSCHDISYLQNCGIHAKENCFVSLSAVIGKNVKISQGSVICENAKIEDDCDIIDSVIGYESKIGNGAVIIDSVIEENVIVGENCIIESACFVSNGCKIYPSSLIKSGTVLADGTVFSKENNKKMNYSAKKLLFLDDGKVCFKCEDFLENASIFAKSVIVALKRCEKQILRIAVMSYPDSDFEKSTFASKVLSQNAYVFDMLFGNEAVFKYAPCVVHADLYAFFEKSGESCYITILNDKGEEICEETERKITKIYSLLCNDTPSSNYAEKKENGICKVPIFELYKCSLGKLFKQFLCGLESESIAVFINGKDDFTGSALALHDALCNTGAVVNMNTKKDLIYAEISNDGKDLKIKQGGKEYDRNHILAIILKNLDVLGINEVKGGKNMPSVFKNIAQNRIKVEKERLSLLDNLLSDSAVQVILLLCILNLSEYDISELYEQLPTFYVYCDEYLAEHDRPGTMERLSHLYGISSSSASDGITLKLASGNVTVIPNRAKGFKIISEATSTEVAKELCVKIEKAIKGENSFSEK